MENLPFDISLSNLYRSYLLFFSFFCFNLYEKCVWFFGEMRFKCLVWFRLGKVESDLKWKHMENRCQDDENAISFVMLFDSCRKREIVSLFCSVYITNALEIENNGAMSQVTRNKHNNHWCIDIPFVIDGTVHVNHKKKMRCRPHKIETIQWNIINIKCGNCCCCWHCCLHFHLLAIDSTHHTANLND